MMVKKILAPVILLLVLTLCIQSCKKKSVHDLSSKEEKLAVMLAKSSAFKTDRILLKKLIEELKNDTTIKRLAKKYTFEDYKNMKDNPYFTDKEKEDSLKRMGFDINGKAYIPPTRKKLFAEMFRNFERIDKEVPEYALLNPKSRSRVMKRASSLYRQNNKTTSLN